MTADPGPHDLESVRVVMAPDGGATPKAVTPAFYEELVRDFDGFAGHILISQHAFSQDWPGWEMHPKGDEIVYLLSGAADFVLWTGAGERVLRVDRPGSYIVVPKGTWHKARPLERAAMLFITPGQGTEHAETPP